MTKYTVDTGVPFTMVTYGNKFGQEQRKTDGVGRLVFDWIDYMVYVNAQKPNWVFSDTPATELGDRSWGGTSDWYLISAFIPRKRLYGLIDPRIVIDEAKEKAEEAARLAKEKADEAARLAKEKADEAARLAEEKATEAARLAEEEAAEAAAEAQKACDYVTHADVTVPETLNSYFPISIRGAEWECPDTGKVKNINGNAIVKFGGYEFELPIRNGYGSPLNLGNFREFRDIVQAQEVGL